MPDKQISGRQQTPKTISHTSEVYLSRVDHSASESTQVLARFLLSDTLRGNVERLIADLNANGLRVHLLSGDRQSAVETVAQTLNVTHYRAEASPSQKQSYVADLQEAGSTVLMLGDGINDAPVLAKADVSMAVGDASALARTAADVICLRPGLDGLTLLLEKSKRTQAIIRQNLSWAAAYNLCAIPLAALAWVPPWAAAIGMASSSLLVAFNAQRLWLQSGSHQKSLIRFGKGRLWNRYSY